MPTHAIIGLQRSHIRRLLTRWLMVEQAREKFESSPIRGAKSDGIRRCTPYTVRDSCWLELAKADPILCWPLKNSKAQQFSGVVEMTPATSEGMLPCRRR